MKFKLKNPFKKKPKKKENLEDLGAPIIEIRVKRYEAENLPVEIGRFLATQVKSSNGASLQYVSEDGSFRRDAIITKNEVQESLIYKLNLNAFSKDEKLVIAKDVIKKQEQRIAKIKDGILIIKVLDKETKIEIDKEIKVNIIDEENKLKHYKVLRDDVKNNGAGSYIEMVNGTRVMHLKYEDGLFYPFKWVKGTATIYADNGVKQKHYKSQQELINEEYADSMAGRGGAQWFRILVIANILFLLANLGFAFYTNSDYKDNAETLAIEGSEMCKTYINNVGEDICEGVIFEKERIRNQTEVKNVTIDI